MLQGLLAQDDIDHPVEDDPDAAEVSEDEEAPPKETHGAPAQAGAPHGSRQGNQLTTPADSMGDAGVHHIPDSNGSGPPSTISIRISAREEAQAPLKIEELKVQLQERGFKIKENINN